MSAQIIDGRKIAYDLKTTVGREVEALRLDGLSCGLAVVRLGDDYSSAVYRSRIAKLAAELGVLCRLVDLPESTSRNDLVAAIAELNDDPQISGIVLLRPLPAHLSESEVFAALDPVKDIEAVHPENAGLLALGVPRYVPSTPASAFHLLDEWLAGTGVDAAKFYRNCLVVIVGRSNNVGKPAVALACARQAAVESIDEWASRSGQLGWHTRRADVLIVAAGVPGLIRAEHVSERTVVLDVGINPLIDPASGEVRTVGDVSFAEVAERAYALTPVPGGIGLVTDVWLLHNTALAARNLATERERRALEVGRP